MTAGTSQEYSEPDWEQLVLGLPATRSRLASEIIESLNEWGYAHIKAPITPTECEMVAAEIGIVMSRSDVKIDRERERAQERTRVVKGRPGPYGSAAFGFHTDNVRVDVVSFYCVEQDALDGALLLLDLCDITEHFDPRELEALSCVDVWAPPVTEPNADKEDFFHIAPLLSRGSDRYRVYYIPWLLRESYAKHESELIEKFAGYVQEKADSQRVRVPFQKSEAVFIDNHRMLHGRAAIAEDSRRHLLRFYLSVPSMSCHSMIRRVQPNQDLNCIG